jgi:molybdopterin converting factor small subunit
MEIEINAMVPGYYKKTKIELDDGQDLISTLNILSIQDDFNRLKERIIVNDKIAKGINIFVNGYSIQNRDIYKNLNDKDTILIIPYVSGG